MSDTDHVMPQLRVKRSSSPTDKHISIECETRCSLAAIVCHFASSVKLSASWLEASDGTRVSKRQLDAENASSADSWMQKTLQAPTVGCRKRFKRRQLDAENARWTIRPLFPFVVFPVWFPLRFCSWFHALHCLGLRRQLLSAPTTRLIHHSFCCNNNWKNYSTLIQSACRHKACMHKACMHVGIRHACMYASTHTHRDTYSNAFIVE